MNQWKSVKITWLIEYGSLTDFEKPETGYTQSTTSPRM